MVNHWWQAATYVARAGLTRARSPTASARSRWSSTSAPTSWWCRCRAASGAPSAWSRRPPRSSTPRPWPPWTTGIEVSIRRVPVEVEKAIPFARTSCTTLRRRGRALFWEQAGPGRPRPAPVRGRHRQGQPAATCSGAPWTWRSPALGPAARATWRRANCGDWVMVEGYSHELTSAAGLAVAARATSSVPARTAEPTYASTSVQPAAAFWAARRGQVGASRWRGPSRSRWPVATRARPVSGLGRLHRLGLGHGLRCGPPAPAWAPPPASAAS